VIGDILPALDELRVAAESMMTSTCTIRRPDGGSTVDPVTLVATPTYLPLPVYRGRCKVQSRALAVDSQESAGSVTTVQRLEVHVPVGAGPFEPFDVVEVTASRNPHLVGAQYQVLEDAVKDHQTAKRLSVRRIGAL